MKKLKLFLIYFLISSIFVSLFGVFAKEYQSQNTNLENPSKIKVKALLKNKKLELKVPEISEKVIGKEFKELDSLVIEKISTHPLTNFFMFLPRGIVGQGKVNKFDGSNLVLDVKGYKVGFMVATDTKFISAKNFRLLRVATPTSVNISNIKEGDMVKVFGNIDNSGNIILKKIIRFPIKVNTTSTISQ